MLKYSIREKISLNLTLINNDGNPENSATINYKLYDENDNIILSKNSLAYNSQLGSYVDIIDPSTEWINQSIGIYYVKWEISNTTESYPNVATEELHIHDYDNKLDKIMGLVHSNVYIDQPEYDDNENLISARLRTYSISSSVGTDNNVLGTYRIKADGDGLGKFVYWQQIEE